MKSILQFPKYDLTSPALFSVLIGCLSLFVATQTPGDILAIRIFFVVVAVPYLAFGFGMWQEERWATYGGFAMFAFGATMRLLGFFMREFQWTHLLMFLAHLSLVWACWDAIQQMNQTPFDPDDEDDEDAPLISFVLLQREQKYLEDVILSKMLESAWGGDYSSGDDGDGFVVGETPVFVISSPHGMYLVHNHDNPYWENRDELLDDIPELRLRNAVADHNAWLSVDLMTNTEEGPEDYYPRIANLIVDLADEETLAILRPDTLDINVWNEELAEKMTSPDAYLTFAEPLNAPVVQVAEGDPDVLAAVATAKKRWPEFVEVFNKRPEGSSTFTVKVKITVDDNTEFIWMDVIGLEPRFVHGKLGNDPVALGDLKLGSQVEVPIEDVQDWCYMMDGEVIGLFSMEAIRNAGGKSTGPPEEA